MVKIEIKKKLKKSSARISPLEYLHGKLLVKEKFEKGCGFDCDDNPNILCLSCEKYIWHAGCLKELENELDIDFKMTVDEKEKTVDQCPECTVRNNEVPRYPRILK